MTDKPEEKPVEQKQTTTKDAIKIMLKALELAGIASSYRENMIFFNDGKDQTTDPTLTAYIKKAERDFVENHAPEIIEKAQGLLENEIGEIREMLG